MVQENFFTLIGYYRDFTAISHEFETNSIANVELSRELNIMVINRAVSM